jgi:hypothetical protein
MSGKTTKIDLCRIIGKGCTFKVHKMETLYYSQNSVLFLDESILLVNVENKTVYMGKRIQ